jgi:hypothetical protein
LAYRVEGKEKEQMCKRIVVAKISGKIEVAGTNSRRLDEDNRSARKVKIKL